jgi:chorismate synthase
MNTYGKIFRVTTWGESHGPAIGCVIDGCPSKIKLSEKDIQKDLNTRKPGQSKITTQRKEADQVQIMSGVFNGQTTGAPISLMIYNQNQHPQDYNNIKNLFRPGHADYTYYAKYGIRDFRGGGRASGRETATRVAAGAVAKKILEPAKVQFIAYTKQIGDVVAPSIAPLESSRKNAGGSSGSRRSPLRETPTELLMAPSLALLESSRKIAGDSSGKQRLLISTKQKTPAELLRQIEKNPIRCPDAQAAKKMIKLIEQVKNEGDSIGGIIELIIKNVPIGLGEPVFDKLDAELAKALMSIGAVKGVEFGAGFGVAAKKGSENNDEMRAVGAGLAPAQGATARVAPTTNNAGGILGGISTGQDIIVRVAVKPTSSIAKKQQTVNVNGKNTEIKTKGRHDPCICPRIIPVVKAMAALVICDFYLRSKISS